MAVEIVPGFHSRRLVQFLLSLLSLFFSLPLSLSLSLSLSLFLSVPLFSQPSPAFIASIISRIRPAAIQLRMLLRDISREFHVNCETTCILMYSTGK